MVSIYGVQSLSGLVAMYAVRRSANGCAEISTFFHNFTF